jgi:uncharacterized peroxidase-related enzyme
VVHHGRGLRRLLRDDALYERIVAGWRSAGLDDRRNALLEYAVKLTRTPAEVTAADVEALRAVGLSDEDLLHLVQVVAYYAYANRVVDGLGVELEPE